MGRGSSGQRKLAEQQLQASNEQRSIYNDWMQQQRGQQQEARGALLPRFEEIYKGAGLTGEEQAETAWGPEQSAGVAWTPEDAAAVNWSPEEENALTQRTIGNVGNAFDAMRQSAARHSAATGNPAGYYDAMDESTRAEARAQSDAQRENLLTSKAQSRQAAQVNYGNRREAALTDYGQRRQAALTGREARRSDQASALQGMGSLYGIDTNLLSRVSGLPLDALMAGNSALNARAQGISRRGFGFNFGPFSYQGG